MTTTAAAFTRAEFDRLLEYSCSLPTGTTIGKRWKCNRNAYRPREIARLDFFSGAPVYEEWPDDWWLGQYVDIDDPDHVGILWRPIIVLDDLPSARN